MKKKKIIIPLVCLALLLSFVFVKVAFPKDDRPIRIVYADQIRSNYLKYLQSKYDFRCGGIGGGFLPNVHEIFLALSFKEKNMTIDQARILHINFTEELKQRVNNHELIRPYLSHYPFTEKGIRIQLSFRKSLSTEQKKHVYLVFFARDRIFYRSKNSETGKIERLYEEPYEEALRIVKEQGKLELSEEALAGAH